MVDDKTVDFAQFQQIIREQLEKDKTIRSVEVEGPAIEALVAEAAALLSVPVRRVEYEIIQRGFSGFLGTGQKNWKIKAYERFVASQGSGDEAKIDDTETEEAVIEDKDGEVFVHFGTAGAFLKVTAPQGNGRRVAESQASMVLAIRHVTNIDNDLVNATVREAKGEYVQVGEFVHNPADDAFVSVTISDDEMKAFIQVNPPGPGGCDISFDMYMDVLKDNQVLFGIDTDFLRHFVDKPVYREKILVAEGKHPVDGQDSYLQYNFELESNKVHLREGADGRVNFKELNIIQNVVAGQPLAKKTPPEKGQTGKTVTGRFLPAKSGKDLPMPLGKGVQVAGDGLTILALTNGQVVLAAGKLNVEPVYMVPGNVDIKSGNIIFLGNVIINGNVEDGFSVKAAGNIEVKGTVERAELDAEGDIIVHQGITGKSSGVIKAGRSLWARFIENATIEAGNMVVVSDGIINSQVAANNRIVCQGKRAHIVGGHLRATEEINAKILGSPTSGTETICEVGFDPKSKEQMDRYRIQRDELEKELEEIQLNIQTLLTLKKQHQSLPEDKELYLQELIDTRNDMVEEQRHINEEIEKLQEVFNRQKNRGKVSASSKVYPGVRVTIRDVKEDVRNEYKAVTFILENGLIRVTKYEEPADAGGPDGYSTH
jgi:uncharacterized protein (DUF342 family)